MSADNVTTRIDVRDSSELYFDALIDNAPDGTDFDALCAKLNQIAGVSVAEHDELSETNVVVGVRIANILFDRALIKGRVVSIIDAFFGLREPLPTDVRVSLTHVLSGTWLVMTDYRHPLAVVDVITRDPHKQFENVKLVGNRYNISVTTVNDLGEGDVRRAILRCLTEYYMLDETPFETSYSQCESDAKHGRILTTFSFSDADQNVLVERILEEVPGVDKVSFKDRGHNLDYTMANDFFDVTDAASAIRQLLKDYMAAKND